MGVGKSSRVRGVGISAKHPHMCVACLAPIRARNQVKLALRGVGTWVRPSEGAGKH